MAGLVAGSKVAMWVVGFAMLHYIFMTHLSMHQKLALMPVQHASRGINAQVWALRGAYVSDAKSLSESYGFMQYSDAQWERKKEIHRWQSRRQQMSPAESVAYSAALRAAKNKPGN